MVNISITNDQPVSMSSDRLFVLPDTDTVFLDVDGVEITNAELDFTQIRVKSVTRSINETIGVAELEIADYVFGDHIPVYCIPIKIISGDPLYAADNIVFRGFMVAEVGQLDSGSDNVTVTAYDYKWALTKIGRVRGKIYTTSIRNFPGYEAMDYNRGESQGSDPAIYDDFRRLERFRYTLGLNNYPKGYNASERTIFNPDGEPNCATDIYGDNTVIFKEPLIDQANDVYELSFYWNYAQIISHIFTFWILPYVNVDKIEITGLDKIANFHEDVKAYLLKRNPESTVAEDIDITFIQPVSFDISSLNPLEALDKAIKAIPGDWAWDILYHGDMIEIKIQNMMAEMFDGERKVLVIGTGEKLATDDNEANVASITINRSIEDRISHAVGIGGALKIETTLELYPNWPRYLIPSDDERTWDYDFGDGSTPGDCEDYDGSNIPSGQVVSDFKGKEDFDCWIRFIKGEENAVVTTETEKRYESIYRSFTVYAPNFNFANSGVLGAHTNINIGSAINYPYGNRWPSKINNYYTGHLSGDEIAFSILSHLNVKRSIEAPLTDQSMVDISPDPADGITYKISEKVTNTDDKKPFVFMYDEDMEYHIYDQKNKESQDLSDSELEEFYNRMKWIIPEKRGISYSIGNNNESVEFDEPQFQRKLTSISHASDASGDLPVDFRDTSYRRIFMTCVVSSDLSEVFDYYSSRKRSKYNGMNLIGYHFDDSQNIVLRVGALYPTPDGKNGHKLEYSETGLSIYPTTVSSNYQFVDWNMLNSDNALRELFIIDTSSIFIQTVMDMVDGLNTYKETISADLGRLDLTYDPLDGIKEVRNSETDRPNSGYYDLDSYIRTVSYNKESDSDVYTTNISAENRSAQSSVLRLARSK